MGTARRLIVALAFLIPCTLKAQQSDTTPVVVLTDEVRAQLAGAWDDSSATQVERAYCAQYVEGRTKTLHFYIVVRADKPDSVLDATHNMIAFRCPVRPNSTTIHVHTPATCWTPIKGQPEQCMLGGIEAWECFASATDLNGLDKSGDPFRLVQCDKHAVVPYWPRTKPLSQ